ncbi:hypothetical protein KC336_g11364 [Hortaea werneckii]|nr:hypothetical protein KC336_g11364 [Hortaea werneckii]
MVKLGYGRTSTTWLCKDRKSTYKVLKVGAADATHREKKAFERIELAAAQLGHADSICVRQPERIFDFDRIGQTYNCFVFEPLGPNLLEFTNQPSNRPFGSQKVRWVATYLLRAMDFLHTNGVAHTDIKLDKIQITLPDEQERYLDAFCASERLSPSIAKIGGDNTLVTASREMKQDELGYPIICDFGSAVFDEERYQGAVQALPYRAQEVILGAAWGHKIDIWNFGVLIWEMLFAEQIFGSTDENGSIESMIKYIGAPPRDFLDACAHSQAFFDSDDAVKLEDRIEEGTSDPEILDFLRCAWQDAMDPVTLRGHLLAKSVGTPSGDKVNDKDDEGGHTSTTTSTRRNASGNVSSVYSGNKVKHLKKEDGIPLWRKDIQYDFLRLVFYDQTRCFTRHSDGTKGHTFTDIYIDSMAKSSKCSKILKEKLTQDQDGAVSMAMVCLLVNVGRMNTTLNFFPEMRAQLRTYHSIPALQAHQDPNAYKQLQDAPRLKSILKGATEDEPQPSTMDEIKNASIPRTNPVNLIFVMSQYAPKISELHFSAPRDFFDLVMRSSLSSSSRARAFLWLIWWYLESDFSPGALPVKVPPLESLTEEQAALENLDTEDEKTFGEVKRKERIAILASEPSPAMTALKRARKEKGLDKSGPNASEDEASEIGWQKDSVSGRPSGLHLEAGSDYTRSPSPAENRGFQAVNASGKAGGNMQINRLLNNDESMTDASPSQPAAPAPAPVKKGPGRGNWRRNKPKPDTVPIAARGPSQTQPATPGSSALGQQGGGLNPFSPPHGANITFQTRLNPDHVPTPSYQAQKRSRGMTQHQSAVVNYRKQQIDYTLDKRISKVHVRARSKREGEGAMLRAWKRIKRLPADYDSEEESVRVRRGGAGGKDKNEKDEHKAGGGGGKENIEHHHHLEDIDLARRPRVFMAGMGRVNGEESDVGEEARSLARSFRRASRRLERWEESGTPGHAMIRRRQQLQLQQQQQQEEDSMRPPPPSTNRRSMTVARPYMDIPPANGRNSLSRQRSSGTGKSRDNRMGSGTPGQEKAAGRGRGVAAEGDEEEEDGQEGGGELDEEDRELLGEVDADESGEEEDEDEEMGDD